MIEVMASDITKLQVDAIVNAAHQTPLGGLGPHHSTVMPRQIVRKPFDLDVAQQF